MNYHFRNLVFEGGGVKGIAYVGALEKLGERGILDRVERVGGTSAGAINAVLLALDYSQDEMQGIMSRLDFNDFADAVKGRFVRLANVPRLVRQYGWCKGEFFRSWIARLIAEKTGNPELTFEQLREKGFADLYLIGTNLSTGFAEVFSAEHTPSMPIADAARRSMSIPLFFAAVRDERSTVFVDGGVFDNYPVKLFDRAYYLDPGGDPVKHGRATEYYANRNERIPDPARRFVYNKETLGCRLDTGREIEMFWEGASPKPRKIGNLFGFAGALARAMMNVQNNQHLHSDDWCRTVYIDTKEIKTTQFDLSDEDKRMLIEQGRIGVARYFEWYDKFDPEDPPKNHPNYVDP